MCHLSYTIKCHLDNVHREPGKLGADFLIVSLDSFDSVRQVGCTHCVVYKVVELAWYTHLSRMDLQDSVSIGTSVSDASSKVSSLLVGS